MAHKMVHVAMMNIRKLQRMESTNTKGEIDHVALAPFYHSQLVGGCQRGSACQCQASIVATGATETEAALRHQLDGTGSTDDRLVAEPQPVEAAQGPLEDAGGAVEDTDGPVDETNGQEHVAVDTKCDEEAAGDHSDGDAAPISHRDSPVQDVLLDGSKLVNLAPLSTFPLADAVASMLDSLLDGRAPSAHVRPLNNAKIRLTGADFRLFEAQNWLNDSTMNSLVALINGRALQVASMRAAGLPAATSLPRSFIFNTYFFSRLHERVGRYDYAEVRRWGLKNELDIASVNRILTPVNVNNLHWVLVMVDVEHRSLLFFDSLVGRATSSLATVRQWLTDEVGSRLGSDAAEAWDIRAWPGVVDLGLPRRAVRGSCGVFVMAAADCFALGVPLCFSQRNIPALRQRMGVALFVDSLTIIEGCALLPDDGDDNVAAGER